MKGNYTKRLKMRFAKPFGYIVWLLILLFAISIVGNINKVRRIREDVAREKERILRLSEENKQLEKQVALTSSPEFIEKEVRNKLGLVKSGEVVVILPEAETLKKLAPEISDTEESLPDPNWVKWFYLFLSK
jgi:cell division protein FtsB